MLHILLRCFIPKANNVCVYTANTTAIDLRETLQNSSQAMVGIDVHPAAWNALVASQNWLTNDTAWRTLLDETPQLQREVAMQLREHINNKRNNGQRFIFLFSLRDEKVFLYHFQ
jgi:translation initiation factor 2-alpha kinase 4